MMSNKDRWSECSYVQVFEIPDCSTLSDLILQKTGKLKSRFPGWYPSLSLSASGSIQTYSLGVGPKWLFDFWSIISIVRYVI